MIKKMLLASLAATAVLLVINMFVFPLVFGDGMPVPYDNLREQPQFAFNLVALLLTGILLAEIVRRTGGGIGAGSVTGALCGLLASVPSGLHMLSMVDVPATSQIAPVLWTTVTWGFAAATGGAVLDRGATS